MRESCYIFLFLLTPHTSGKRFVYNKTSHLYTYFLSQLFEFPIEDFLPRFFDKLIVQVRYLGLIPNFCLCLSFRPLQKVYKNIS